MKQIFILFHLALFVALALSDNLASTVESGHLNLGFTGQWGCLAINGWIPHTADFPEDFLFGQIRYRSGLIIEAELVADDNDPLLFATLINFSDKAAWNQILKETPNNKLLNNNNNNNKGVHKLRNTFILQRFQKLDRSYPSGAFWHTEQVIMRYFERDNTKHLLIKAKSIEIYTYHFPCIFCTSLFTNSKLLSRSQAGKILSFSYQYDIDTIHLRNLRTLSHSGWTFQFVATNGYPHTWNQLIIQELLASPLFTHVAGNDQQRRLSADYLLYTTLQIFYGPLLDYPRYIREPQIWIWLQRALESKDDTVIKQYLLNKGFNSEILSQWIAIIDMTSRVECDRIQTIEHSSYPGQVLYLYQKALPIVEYEDDRIGYALTQFVSCEEGFTGMFCHLLDGENQIPDHPVPQQPHLCQQNVARTWQDTRAGGYSNSSRTPQTIC
ncbi:hypothetical protein SAMD00019534_055990, partial [Acytostelium subglobosum LB1]|uniref:hypothetical protein n=1 Tax=Acytostelium subglobosum LB1 TaxID=1410327 RepID=UPI000644D9B6